MTTLVSHSLCFHAIFRTLQWHQSFCSFSEDDDSKIKNKILFALVSLCPVVFHLLYKFRKILITIFQRTQRQIQVIIGSWIGIGSSASIVGCWACHWGDLRGNHRWGGSHHDVDGGLPRTRILVAFSLKKWGRQVVHTWTIWQFTDWYGLRPPMVKHWVLKNDKLIIHTVRNLHFFVQKFNFGFPRKLSTFGGEKLVKMLWFWTF